VRKLLTVIRQQFRFVIVDTWASYGETMLAVLESADRIVLPFTLELTSVKNARVFIEVMRKVGLDPKVSLLVNRVDQPNGLKLSEIEGGLGRKSAYQLSTDEASLRLAMNRGLPVVDTHPDSKLAREFAAVAKAVAAEPALTR